MTPEQLLYQLMRYITSFTMIYIVLPYPKHFELYDALKTLRSPVALVLSYNHCPTKGFLYY